MATTNQAVMVCDHCDSVYRKPAFRSGMLARCTRCGGVLERMQRLDVNGMLALTVAGLIAFVLANVYPIVRIEVRGAHGGSTLWGAIIASWQDGIAPIAVLTALTLFFFPLVELLAAAYVLWPLARKRRPPGFGAAMRILRFARDWSMPEVFLLGIFVAMVKLASMARITPGMGLWSFAALTGLITLVASFDHSHLWDIATENQDMRANQA
ncbi:MAG: paraquat-inducible protein A [Rudaea sp.]|nr:paraquat-inducible protein A [Rudaea sp.]